MATSIRYWMGVRETSAAVQHQGNVVSVAVVEISVRSPRRHGDINPPGVRGHLTVGSPRRTTSNGVPNVAFEKQARNPGLEET
ncbi:MAG: hypothetical protein O2960_05630 [Verrucomicrobia bacterium]|nr:hypothetical protein [Verrucomicrobiota bacterium]